MERVEHRLAAGQRTLWLLHSMSPQGSAYNASGAGRFVPGPDPVALARAVRALTVRHDMLRSRFVERQGRVVRIVGPVQPHGQPLQVVDLGAVDDASARRELLAAARRPYDLSRDGAFRAVLLRRRSDAVLLLGTHHIASDATSNWLIWRDFIDAYRAFGSGLEPAWLPVHTGYHDYVAREEDLLASPRGARMQEYWRTITDGACEVQLPLDRPRPATPAYHGQTLTRRLPDQLTRAVREAAARAGVSTFALLMGAFQVLLHRYSGQRDFSLVCPASTRRRSSAQLVGYFVNPLTLRVRIDAATTVAQLVEEAATQLRQGLARIACPYERGPFRVAITLVPTERFGGPMQDAYDHGVDVAGRNLSHVEVPQLEGQCDLSVEILEGSDYLTVAFRYDADLFEPVTIDRMLTHYLTLIGSVAREPSCRVEQVPMVEADERAHLLSLGGAG